MKLIERTRQFVKYRQFTVVKPFGHSHQSEQFLISLCDMSSEVTQALDRYFHDIDAVEILQGDILDLSCDALVSPANSFGDMGGGLDKAIDEFYERKAQKIVRTAITEQFFGELPVGNALILKMNTKQFPFLIVAPTMRVPGNVQETINAYLAMRAVLVAIIHHNRLSENTIQSVAIPGFCSGVGGMSPQESAGQMRTAYDVIIGEGWKKIIHPALAPYAMKGK